MKIKTKKGYDFFEVASTIQKAIRRGDEEVALFFSVELFDTHFDEYLWKRLKIITSVDVGLAEPIMPATIQALYSMYVAQKKKKDAKNAPERLFLTHAVLLLCRAKKSRLVDWTLLATWGEHEHANLPIPDYAYDKHNAKGRSLGRGLDHFFNEGTRLENHVEQDREADRKSRAYLIEKKREKKENDTLFAV